MKKLILAACFVLVVSLTCGLLSFAGSAAFASDYLNLFCSKTNEVQKDSFKYKGQTRPLFMPLTIAKNGSWLISKEFIRVDDFQERNMPGGMRFVGRWYYPALDFGAGPVVYTFDPHTLQFEETVYRDRKFDQWVASFVYLCQHNPSPFLNK